MYILGFNLIIKSLFSIVLLLDDPNTSYAIEEREEDILYHKGIVEKVNQMQNGTWKAKLNLAGLPHPKPKPSGDLRERFAYHMKELMTGRQISANETQYYEELVGSHASIIANLTKTIAQWNQYFDAESDTEFPESFDARLKWKKCGHMSHPTINQGSCGSCFAVSSISVIADRICVFSNETMDVQLSVAEYMSCNNSTGPYNSCHGGFSSNVFQYWIDNGLTTGGAYGSNEGCRPYEFNNDCGKPCSRTAYRRQVIPECRKTCNKMYDKTFHNDKHYGKNMYWIVDPEIKDHHKFAERNMKWELMHRGPFVGSLSLVSEDFMHYHSGVYQYVTGEIIYNHAVRMLGWGVENGTPYWLASNSWGRDWGENGFFKILRGSNELHVETRALAGTPLL